MPSPLSLRIAAAVAAGALCGYGALLILPGPMAPLVAAVCATAALRVLQRRGGRGIGPEPAEAELLANLSHEMRTPLNGILGLTQVLLDAPAGVERSEQRELLEMIKASAESILRVLNDLFDYSRVRTGRILLDPREFRFRRWFRQTVGMHAPQAHRKGLDLSYWVEPEVPDLLVGDPHRLRQVLSNLLANAIKFTEAGEVVVEVFGEDAPLGVRLKFTVRDTGSGIPDGVRSRMFQPFTQGENVTPQHGGLGLGLAISSGIVSRMGGSIDAESEPGGGSQLRFDVVLGVAQEDRPAAASKTFPGVRALVVDHHPWEGEILARKLRSLGIDAAMAPDSEAALELVSRQGEAPFSLLLLDSSLPGVDVLALADAIHEQARMATVLLTRSRERVDPEELRLHGIAGQLTKPVATTHLVRVMEILSRGEILEKPEDVQTQGMDRLLLPGVRVLLAEDHPVNRTVAVRLLESQGAEVAAVANGREALERWSKERFDLLVLDVEMPEMDGLHVAREIRRLEEDRGVRVPIVALTAHARDEHRSRCLAAGMDAFVTKPFQEAELVTAMRDALRGERAREPGPVFDREAAIRLANGDEALLGELIAIFLDETPEAIQKIETALRGGNSRELERLAHRLNGALLTLSAPAASRSALDLETAAREGRDPDAREALARLKEAIGRLQEALQVQGSRSESGAMKLPIERLERR